MMGLRLVLPNRFDKCTAKNQAKGSRSQGVPKSKRMERETDEFESPYLETRSEMNVSILLAFVVKGVRSHHCRTEGNT